MAFKEARGEPVDGTLKGELALKNPKDWTQARKITRVAVNIY